LHLCLQQYLQIRKNTIKALREAGEEPYPHKFNVTISLSNFIVTYDHLESGTHLDDVTVSIAGQIVGFFRV